MCNSINYNVIFMDEIHFNVMTMMLIYYWMTKKYLFYYCDVNVCEAMNLSICMKDKKGIQIQIQFGIKHCFTLMKIPTNCTLHMSILTECVH
jgi:hypothetical protein